MSEQIFSSRDFESLSPAPSAERLRKLAAVSLTEASESGILRVTTGENLEPVYTWVEERAFTDENGQDRYTKVSGRLVQRVEGRIMDFDTQVEKPENYLDEWSFRMREMEQTRDDDGEWRGVVQTYAADWSGEGEVKLSKAELKAIPGVTEEEVERTAAAEALYGELGDESSSMEPTLRMSLDFDNDKIAELIRETRARRSAGDIEATDE